MLIWLHPVLVVVHEIFVASCRIFPVAPGLSSCGMWNLVSWPGIEPRPPALGAWSLSHWTTREVPGCNAWYFLPSPPGCTQGVQKVQLQKSLGFAHRSQQTYYFPNFIRRIIKYWSSLTAENAFHKHWFRWEEMQALEPWWVLGLWGQSPGLGPGDWAWRSCTTASHQQRFSPTSAASGQHWMFSA